MVKSKEAVRVQNEMKKISLKTKDDNSISKNKLNLIAKVYSYKNSLGLLKKATANHSRIKSIVKHY